MSRLALLCHIEHLPAYRDSAADLEAFSLNLSVALVGNPAGWQQATALFRPWLARKITELKVVLIPDDPALPKEPAPVVRVSPQFWNGSEISFNAFPNRGLLVNRLESEFTSCSNDLNCFSWDARPDDETELTGTGRKPWHIFLGQTAQLPTPIPQILNLSTLFFLRAGDLAGKKVIAAPILEFDRFTVEPDSDVASVTEMPDRRSGLVWKYSRTSGTADLPEIGAYFEPCRVTDRPVAGDTFLDLNTLWVRNPQNNNDFDQDWGALLASRMADAFDLSQRIIDYLRSQLSPPAPVCPPAGTVPAPGPSPQPSSTLLALLPVYRRMFFTALRDIAGIGLSSGPDDIRWIETIFPDAQTSIDAIVLAEERTFGSLDAWCAFVRQKVPSIADLAILKNFESVLSPSATVREMEHVHQALLDPQTLALLVKEQWRAVFLEARLGDLARSVDRVDLSGRNLRYWLAASNLGRFWKGFVGSGLTDASGNSKVKEHFRCYFQGYVIQRFGGDVSTLPADCQAIPGIGASRTFHPAWLPPAPAPLAGLVAFVGEWAACFAPNLLPADIAGAVTATDIPHPVSILVDKVAGETNDDLLANLSGVAILMREAGNNANRWRCLNMATARLAGDNQPTLFDRPVLVPSRLNYTNDLKQAIISYNNHPLSAPSPVSGLTSVKPETSGENDWNSLVVYSHNHTAKLSPLKFGTRYEVAPFIVGNAGVLPSQITRKSPPPAIPPSNPTCPSPVPVPNPLFSPGDIDLAGCFAVPATSIRQVPYQRRVRVGKIRASGGSSTGQECTELNLPIIPEGVYPRLRDMRLGSEAKEHESPLVLLAPYDAWKDRGAKSEYKFQLRLPATDINTWDRWVASGRMYGAPLGSAADLTNLRVAVWRDYHARIEGRSDVPECNTIAPGADASMDDPALAPMLFAELFRFSGTDWVPASTPTVRNWARITVDRRTATDSIALAQAVPSDVACSVTETSTESIATDAGGRNLNITLRKGEVYKLRVSACLPLEAYPASAAEFRPFARIYGDLAVDARNPGHYNVSPFEVFIETATDKVVGELEDRPTPGDGDLYLRRRFSVKFVPEGAPRETQFADMVKVRFVDGDRDEAFKYVYKAEVRRQLWRWQGRDTQPHPASLVPDPPQTDPSVVRWEAAEYGNRSDLDYSVMNMESVMAEGANAPAGSRNFTYVEHLTGERAKHEELRGAHYRFKATVYSRYLGYMPTPEEGQRSVTEWKSDFVPCRLKTAVKVPKVKLILPLTQSDEESTSGTAGLLVVLDEPWYEVGGIGESIGAEVVITPDPGNPDPGPDKFYYEVSSDPTISSEIISNPIVGTNLQDPARPSVSFNGIRGPVGHSFDRSSDAPLFLSTSFIVPSPLIRKNRNDSGKALGAWGMCKIKLRRIVKTLPGRQLESAFTDPFWTQYLPEFSVFETNGRFSDLTLRRSDAATNTWQIRSPNGEIKALHPGVSEATGNNQFELYLILTRKVFDVTGRSDQEAYVGVLSQSGQEWKTNDPIQISAEHLGKLRARVVEVQSRKNPSRPKFQTGEELWKHLFHKDVEDRDRYRIVRISDPFGTEPLNRC